MSIIEEALKKAEKERKGAIDSKEYLNKILGPERKASYKKEGFKTDRSPVQPNISPSKSENMKPRDLNYMTNKRWITLGMILMTAIIFLTLTNIFFISSPVVKTVTPSGATNLNEDEIPIEAEAYSDLKSEIALIESKSNFIDKMSRVFKSDSIQNEFLSNFSLNGIVYDTEYSWAIINNETLRVGDTLNGAKVVSIDPQKVVLLFKDEKFSLFVK